MSAEAIDGFESRFAAATREGRPILVARESRIVYVEPFILAAEVEPGFLDLAIRRVTTIAFILATIVGGIVISGSAPKMIGFIAGAWFVPACIARIYNHRRKKQLGKVLVDFERERLERMPRTGAVEAFSLSDVVIEITEAEDGETPWWVVARPRGHGLIRLGMGTNDDVRRLSFVFRRYGVAVKKTEPVEPVED